MQEALKAADELSAMGYSTTVADARFAKPLDYSLIKKLALSHELLITIEEGAPGGFGSHVLSFMSSIALLDGNLKIRTMTLPDKLVHQDTPERQYEDSGLCSAGIINVSLQALSQKNKVARA